MQLGGQQGLMQNNIFASRDNAEHQLTGNFAAAASKKASQFLTCPNNGLTQFLPAPGKPSPSK